MENVIINLERLVWTSIFIHPLRKYFLPIIVAINRLLIGILALILIAGVAQSSEADPEDIIFENGDAAGTLGFEMDLHLPMSDFKLDEDAALTDVHFVMILSGGVTSFDRPIDYTIFGDTGTGFPDTNNVIGSGNAVNVEMMRLAPNDPRFEVWFDLDVPIPLDADVRYWLALHAGTGFVDIKPEDPRWAVTNADFGEITRVALGGNFDNIVPEAEFAPWFQLTSKKQDDGGGNGKVIGREIIPIESTGLLLAGMQTSAFWMLPALAGIAGARAYFVRTRMNKE